MPLAITYTVEDNKLRDYMLEFRYQFRPKAPPDTRWLPLTRAWQGSACSWLVLHDMYHHLPTDTGTLAEELATLGAEYYIVFEGTGLSPEFCGSGEEVTAPGLNALVSSAAGIVGSAKEDCTHGPDSFRLARLETPPVSEELNPIFMSAEKSAAGQLAELIEGDSDLEWNAALAAFREEGLISSWLRSGYLNAKARFPDRERIQDAWKAAEAVLRNHEKGMAENETLVISLHDYDAIFRTEPVASLSRTRAEAPELCF